MDDAELTADVAERTGLSNSNVERVLNAAIESITDALANGSKVELARLGTFRVAKPAALTSRDSGPDESAPGLGVGFSSSIDSKRLFGA